MSALKAYILIFSGVVVIYIMLVEGTVLMSIVIYYGILVNLVGLAHLLYFIAHTRHHDH